MALPQDAQPNIPAPRPRERMAIQVQTAHTSPVGSGARQRHYTAKAGEVIGFATVPEGETKFPQMQPHEKLIPAASWKLGDIAPLK